VPPRWLGEEPVASAAETAHAGAEKAEDGADKHSDGGPDSGASGAGRGGKAGRSGAEGEDPYSILGIDRKASQAEIRAAYLRLVKELHPDGREPGAEADAAAERLKVINDAYQTLKAGDWQAVARRSEPPRRSSTVFV